MSPALACERCSGTGKSAHPTGPHPPEAPLRRVPERFLSHGGRVAGSGGLANGPGAVAMFDAGQHEAYDGLPSLSLFEVFHTDGRGRPSYEMSPSTPRQVSKTA